MSSLGVKLTVDQDLTSENLGNFVRLFVYAPLSAQFSPHGDQCV